VGPVDSPQDLLGCFHYFFRLSGCFLSIYIIMFMAIIIAAILSLFFFR
jgi:hypothetical protein